MPPLHSTTDFSIHREKLGQLTNHVSIYQPRGCPEVVSYEALEKHERQCDYRPEKCSSCESPMLRKEWLDHEMHCPSVRLTCTDCQIVYQRGDASTQHTELICVNEQLRQAREKNERLVEKHREELLKLRLDCEERLLRLTGKRTMWRESPLTSKNNSNVFFWFQLEPLRI